MGSADQGISGTYSFPCGQHTCIALTLCTMAGYVELGFTLPYTFPFFSVTEHRVLVAWLNDTTSADRGNEPEAKAKT